MSNTSKTINEVTMLGITNFHNDIILSTLSINSHGFAFGLQRPRSNGDSIPYLYHDQPLD